MKRAISSCSSAVRRRGRSRRGRNSPKGCGALVTSCTSPRPIGKRLRVSLQQLQELGWSDGRNVQIETRNARLARLNEASNGRLLRDQRRSTSPGSRSSAGCGAMIDGKNRTTPAV
jgi:hypothetical protein